MLAGVGLFLFALFLFPIASLILGAVFSDPFAEAVGERRRQHPAQPVPDLRSGLYPGLVYHPLRSFPFPIGALDFNLIISAGAVLYCI